MKISGRMTEEDAREILEKFDEYVPETGTFSLHLEIHDLTHYESAARARWVENLQTRRDRCECIVLYGARPVIRMVASTVALILRVPVEFR